MQRLGNGNRQSPEYHQTKYTPRTRPVHESAHDGQLMNADPNKKYVWAPVDDNHPMNYAYYESMGYNKEICEKGKDTLKIHLGAPSKVGDPYRFRDMVLMSCSKERADEIFQKGSGGNTGQEYFDKLMARIRRNPTNKKPHEIVPGLHETYDISDPDELNNNVFR